MKSLFLFTLFLISSLAQAEVRLITQMSELRPLLTEPASKTWVVFDLDNTVMEPVQTLGSDQWFDYMVQRLGGVDPAIEAWSRVQRATAMRPVEAGTPQLIRALQAKGFRVFALTARPAELAETTRQQLLSLGVSFEKIVSIGPGQSKGSALAGELRANRTPSLVLFIDDKEKHVHSVDEALAAFPLTHHELRYGAADPEVKTFSPEIAQIEMSYFDDEGVLLSDREAANLISRGGAVR